MLNRRHLLLSAAMAAGLGGCAPTYPVPTEGRTRTLINAARAQGQRFVLYDGSYTPIAYPGGDIPPGRGACTDVIIRAYRALGVDLQRLVHEDMTAHFSVYPNLWGLTASDANIDHRRVPNLARFFERFGETLVLSRDATDYQPGDIITMHPQHIALISDRRVHGRADRLVIIQNRGLGVREDVQDFVSWPLTGHFRYALAA
jgi:uncharacterized protein YijF (DUF1287 family)